MSWFLQVAIEHGLTILNWYENLPKHEVPPEHVWEDPEGLDEWWAAVEARREDGSSVGGSGGDADVPEDMSGNDLARQFRKMAEDD